MTHPQPSTEPDLVALPSWGISTEKQGGPRVPRLRRDGVGSRPGADGHRGVPPPGHGHHGRLPVLLQERHRRSAGPRSASLEYDPDPGHEHWHFQQFVRYSLLNSTQSLVVRSQKDGFCLAPTDAIDLVQHGAVWNPDQIGLAGACGDADRASGRARRCRPAGATPTCRRCPASRSTSPTCPTARTTSASRRIRSARSTRCGRPTTPACARSSSAERRGSARSRAGLERDRPGGLRPGDTMAAWRRSPPRRSCGRCYAAPAERAAAQGARPPRPPLPPVHRALAVRGAGDGRRGRPPGRDSARRRSRVRRRWPTTTRCSCPTGRATTGSTRWRT